MTEYKRYEYSLLDLCLKVHMSQSGAGDHMTESDLADAKREIQIRLNNWQRPTHTPHFDHAVRSMCIAVLSEYGGRVDHCTRKNGHDGPCNGLPSYHCRNHDGSTVP